ncbi:MAG: hypothetical protein IMF18_12625 [Proteobacteria bacterium]|nr:hypothetical protein [Pseudomonadota bacterium]
MPKVKAYYFLIVGLLFLVWPAILSSQNDISDSSPGLTASLDRKSVRFGSIAALTLEYCLPEGGRLPKDAEIKGLEGITTVERVTGPDRIRLKLLVDRLDSWKTGPLSLSYLDRDGKTQVLTADPVSIRVVSNLGEKSEEAQLRPIQGIIPTKALWLKYLPWGAGLLGILLVCTGFLWWRKKGCIQEVSAELHDPPHLRAIKEIEQLEAQGLFEEGRFKGFYFRFSEILRRYLERLRGFPAAELTTEEIAWRIDNVQDRRLLPLLRQADLVKFAGAVPTSARKEGEVKTALSYIRETSPAVESHYVGFRPCVFEESGLVIPRRLG